MIYGVGRCTFEEEKGAEQISMTRWLSAAAFIVVCYLFLALSSRLFLLLISHGPRPCTGFPPIIPVFLYYITLASGWCSVIRFRVRG